MHQHPDAVYKDHRRGHLDSPGTTAEQCHAAQVAAVCAAIDFALAHCGAHG